MSRRNTISREFFATIAAVLVLGLSVMCAIQTALSAAYFIGERKSSLTDVLNGATALSERFADEGSIVTKPLQGEDVLERAHSGFELFNTASGALVFIADENGQILLHTGDDAFTGAGVPASYIDELNEGNDIFETGTLDGVYCAKYYTAGRRITVGGQDGYLFAASPMAALGSYMTDMLTMFGISAAVILILCSILCWVLAKRITGPIEDISEAARRLGSGDFTARAPVDGCVELADFATTFNNMAARLQTIDNSRGQFMGNIARPRKQSIIWASSRRRRAAWRGWCRTCWILPNSRRARCLSTRRPTICGKPSPTSCSPTSSASRTAKSTSRVWAAIRC